MSYIICVQRNESQLLDFLHRAQENILYHVLQKTGWGVGWGLLKFIVHKHE